MKKEGLSVETTRQDLAEACPDAFGVLYSPDGKRLLSCDNSQPEEYVVKEGTEVICRGAFLQVRRPDQGVFASWLDFNKRQRIQRLR